MRPAWPCSDSKPPAANAIDSTAFPTYRLRTGTATDTASTSTTPDGSPGCEPSSSTAIALASVLDLSEDGSPDLPLSGAYGVTAHADGDTVTVPECCDHDDYQSVFSGRFARRTSKRYQRRGLTPAARAIADYVESRGISGATVLEIGGGVGHLQVELLRRGASHVTNLEISQNYEAEAARILDEAGMTDRVTRRFLDIAHEPDA